MNNKCKNLYISQKYVEKIIKFRHLNSKRATQFRIWATKVLKEFIIKSFVLDDERLKQGRYYQL